MRIITAREQYEMTSPWRLADLGVRPDARPPGFPGQGGEPVLPKGRAQQARPNEDWMANDWRSATDGGAFHSSVRPALSSDIPHPSELLNPNDKRQAHHVARVAASEDPDNDPWGVLNGTGTSFEDLVNNHMSHFQNMTPEQNYAGRVWYRAAHDYTKDLADKTTGDHQRAVDTFAAYSPRKDWDENVEQGTHFLTHYDGSDPDFKIPTLDEHTDKAKQIYHAPPGYDHRQILGGPKTASFRSNILDPTDFRAARSGVDDDEGYYEHPVNPATGERDWRMHQDQNTTVDTHHARGQMTPHGADLSNAKYGTPAHFDRFNDVGIGGKGYDLAYDLHSRASWEATRRLNAMQGDDAKHQTPKQVQAGPWGKFKADVDAASVRRQNMPGPGEPPRSWDPEKKNWDVEKWKAKNPLTEPIPRYQREPGGWVDPRRPDIGDLRSAPNWGRRPTHFGSVVVPRLWDHILGDWIARHPQHHDDVRLASTLYGVQATLDYVDRLLGD
jgi:hypothetical protein